MAKIIFWRSAIDPTQREEFNTDRTNLYGVLEDLEIEKEPLSVILNGETPDEIPLDLELQKDDVLEIRRLVHGNSSSSKNTWANVLSIVSLVAATILTAGGAAWWAVGVTLAGGIASGALRYRAAKLALRAGGQSQSEIDVDTNNFSLTTAQNEARPLQPLPVPMGSIRMAPDFLTEPYPSFHGGVIRSAIARPVIEVKRITPEDPNDWTTIIPAGFITSSPYVWPAYDLKLDPSYDLADLSSFTTLMKESFAPDFFVSPMGSPNIPVLVYHHDPADPYYGRVCNWACFNIQETRSSNQALAIQHFEWWYDSSAITPPWQTTVINKIFNDYLFIWDPSSYSGFWDGTNPYIWPIDWWNVNLIQAINLYLLNEYNFGSYDTPTDYIGNVRYRTWQTGHIYSYSPSLAATHLLSFGLGDLTISDQRVEKTLRSDIINSQEVTVDKFTWQMPSTWQTFYHRNTRMLEGATLNNNNDISGPDVYVQPNDHNQYNFIYRVTPENTGVVIMLFQGNLYYAADDGIKENNMTIEIQFREVGAANWDHSEYVFLFNDNTHIFRHELRINTAFFAGNTFEFRIRKVELDDNNNNGKHVAQFDLMAFICFMDFDAYNFMGQEHHGLFLVANTQTSGSSNKFSALVEAKCWVYDEDDDSWNWEHTRNPAWWFLYFARGGFKNPLADGTFTFPWSPTFGWVNGPGHPSNTEIMFGCGMPDSKLDIEGIKEWANFCDDKNLKIDLVFKDAATESEILEKIANVGRASVSYYKGLLSVVYEDNTQIPVGLYGMGNIIQGSFTADYSVANTPSKVIGTYVDRNADWESKTVEANVPFANPDDLNFITVTLDGITEESQAQREVNILAARQFFQKRTYTWKVDNEGLIAKRGDLVYLSHDSTQFSYSGRVSKFLLNENDEVIGIETSAEIKDNEVAFVTIRLPNGELKTYSCLVNDCQILFNTNFDIEDAPYYLKDNNDLLNEDSRFNKSYPEDYIFIAGPLATTGKVVRISQIQPDEQMNFTITAIDEDPAMWSYEFGPVIDSESFNNSTILSRVFNVSYRQLGNGKVKLFWEVEGADFIKIVNVDTGLLITANGMVSFSQGEVILELVPGSKYTLRIEPFVIGSPYKQENKVLVVWA